MKKIFLIGDPSIDWLVYYEPNQTPRRSNKLTKNLENNPRAVIHKLPGGALMLKEFLAEVMEADDQLVTYADMSVDDIEEHVAIQTVSVVKKPDTKNHPEIIRVDQFLGYSNNPVADPEKRLTITQSPADADLIIIDDAGNGLRDERNGWIKDLSVDKDFQIIHKINWPLNNNQLATELANGFGDKMIAVINADDLREHGLEISRELSWDKTIADFLSTFPLDKRLEDLRKFNAIIIRFNLEAAVVIFRITNSKVEKKDEDAFDYYFFYDPSKIEGELMDNTQGNMQGLTHAFIAAMARGLLYPVTGKDYPTDERKIVQYNTLSAIIPGMKAARNLLKFGYTNIDGFIKIDYPYTQIFPKEIFEPNAIDDMGGEGKGNKKGKSKTEIQLAGISGFMDGNGPHSLLNAHLSLGSKELISSIAIDYVKKKQSPFLNKIPVFETGDFKTYDPEEIESFRSFNKLVKEYLSGSSRKPLSIAVFGAPGSGKSFGVKQIAGSENVKDKIKVIETNLSQLQSVNDLVPVFHESRDINLSGKIPLIFFDEFDCPYNDRDLGWIKYFLAPMQDGLFKDGENIHPLGRAIFIFAGGTCHSFEEFAEPLRKKNKKTELQNFKTIKGPDFVSRLKGFINIKGIDKKNAEDILYPLRRAIVLKSIFERNYKNLFDPEQNINVDNEVLAGLIKIEKFEFGARSLETIILMSDLTNERSFKKSNLPSNNLLSLHIETGKFRQLMKEEQEKEQKAAKMEFPLKQK